MAVKHLIRLAFLTLGLAATGSASAFFVDFETLPNGATPTDNGELTTAYTDGTTTITLGFDTDEDLSIDLNGRIEQRGTDPVGAYKTAGVDDADLTPGGTGGQWLFRRPNVNKEFVPIDMMGGDDFLAAFSGALTNNFSGEIWDLDAGEQFRIDALAASNTVIATILSPVGSGSAAVGSAGDGLPFAFAFTNLQDPIAILRISQMAGMTSASFALDNLNTSPTRSTRALAVVVSEPTTLALLALSLAAIGTRRLRATA